MALTISSWPKQTQSEFVHLWREAALGGSGRYIPLSARTPGWVHRPARQTSAARRALFCSGLRNSVLHAGILIPITQIPSLDVERSSGLADEGAMSTVRLKQCLLSPLLSLCFRCQLVLVHACVTVTVRWPNRSKARTPRREEDKGADGDVRAVAVSV